MRQIDSLALSALTVAPIKVWARYCTRPITQRAMIATEAPLFTRLVVDPKMNFKAAAVTNTEHASEPAPKATVLTLRLILSAEQMPARAAGSAPASPP